MVFYTGPRFESEAYGDMVTLLHRLAEEWGLPLIDMWSDEAFCKITPDQRRRYMADPVHPTHEGYLEWWTPYMEKAIHELLGTGEST